MRARACVAHGDGGNEDGGEGPGGGVGRARAGRGRRGWRKTVGGRGSLIVINDINRGLGGRERGEIGIGLRKIGGGVRARVARQARTVITILLLLLLLLIIIIIIIIIIWGLSGRVLRTGG